MVRLLAATGLRIGELLALRSCTLDLEGGSLSVRESVFEQVPSSIGSNAPSELPRPRGSMTSDTEPLIANLFVVACELSVPYGVSENTAGARPRSWLLRYSLGPSVVPSRIGMQTLQATLTCARGAA